MEKPPEKDAWVFVPVENPGSNESYVGYTDEKAEIAYIPAFLTKDAAQSCFINLPRDSGKKYEIQAVILEELARDAARNGFLIFVLDSEGRIQHKIDPAEV
jgi:hypothetical protein